MPHQQTTIQTFLHLYSGPGIAGALQTGKELQSPPVVLHRVVFGHSAQLLDAQHATQVQLRVHWPVGRLRLVRRHPEALVEPRQKLALGLRQGASASQTKATSLSWKVPLARSTLPLASGLWANIWVIPSSPRARLHWVDPFPGTWDRSDGRRRG